MNIKPYQVGHALLGAMIGFAGLAGLPVAMFVLVREYFQEHEGEAKAKRNIAWHDLTEWAVGGFIGLAVHLGLKVAGII